MSNSSILKLNTKDNLWVALTDLKAGETVDLDGRSLTLAEDISAKHKFTERDMQEGEELTLYGVLVGKTLNLVRAGCLIHTHNTVHAAAGFDAEQTSVYQWQEPQVEAYKEKTFMGFQRSDGQVGTANHWLVVPLVFCQNRNLSTLREIMLEELGYSKTQTYHVQMRQLADKLKAGASHDEILAWQPDTETQLPKKADRLFPHVDGVKFLLHEGGCGGTRQDSDALCALLAGYITHPNVAGVTVMSLGCQHAQVDILKEEIAKRNPEFSKPMFVFEQQKAESESKMIQDAMKSTLAGLMEANLCERTPQPLSKLVVGVECGASDGFSGISANPSIGHCSDMVVKLGGAVMLAEFPELCGVEQEIISRCQSPELAQRFKSLLDAYAKKAESVGSGFDMNPSPGNIKDGLITDAIKSAGAAKKGGNAPVSGVLDYTEPCQKPGLHLLNTPGNDVESTTALVGSGANVILFSTGLGTPTGNPIVPVIKVSSNTELAELHPDMIDIDAGAVIRGTSSIPEMGATLLDKVIRVGSGQEDTKAMILGQDDFIPWKRGVSL